MRQIIELRGMAIQVDDPILKEPLREFHLTTNEIAARWPHHYNALCNGYVTMAVQIQQGASARVSRPPSGIVVPN